MGFKDRLLFAFVVVSTLVLVLVDIFVGMTIFNGVDALVPMAGNTVNVSAALKNVMYMFAVAFGNFVIIGINVFLFHYKFHAYEQMAEEDDDYDELGG